MSITDNFKKNVVSWVTYDHKIDKATKAIQLAKNKKEELAVEILDYMKKNDLKDKELKISNSRLKYQTTNKVTPLTKKFISEALKEFLDKQSDDNEVKVKEAISIVYNPRRRMEICLGNYFENDELAIEAVEFIFSKRQKSEINKLKRKVYMEEMVISNDNLVSD